MADPLRDQLYLESRFRPVTKALTACVKADLESGLTLTEMQARYAPYGVFSYNRPLTRRSVRGRFKFETDSHGVMFETLSQAEAYLERWKEIHRPLTGRGCPTCANCTVKDNGQHCSFLGPVPWTQAWTRPESCGQWQGGGHE